MADTELNLIEKAVMDVVLSREGRRRYNKGDSLTLDPSDLRDIVRLTMAKCATPPSPSTAPEAFDPAKRTGRQLMDRWNAGAGELAERAAFEQHERDSNLRRVGEGQYENPCVESAWEGWKARAALASRPAEVDDEGLPSVLFDDAAVYREITRHLGPAHCHSHNTISTALDAVVRLLRQERARRAAQGG